MYKYSAREAPVIKKVDPSTIPWKNDRPGGKHNPRTVALREAIASLQLGEAIQLPCTWSHRNRVIKSPSTDREFTTELCNGTAAVYSIGKPGPGLPQELKATCVNKVVYVLRRRHRDG